MHLPRLLLSPTPHRPSAEPPVRGVFRLGPARDGSVLLGSRDRHGRWCHVEMVPEHLVEGLTEIMEHELEQLDPGLALIA